MADTQYFQFRQARGCILISLTPLIDVVFILLLFFMLASNFDVENSLSVRSAFSSEAEPVSPESSGKLHILSRHSVVLEGEILNYPALFEALELLHARDSNYSLSVTVAKGARVQELLDLLAMAEKIGLTRMSMESSLP